MKKIFFGISALFLTVQPAFADCGAIRAWANTASNAYKGASYIGAGLELIGLPADVVMGLIGFADGENSGLHGAKVAVNAQLSKLSGQINRNGENVYQDVMFNYGCVSDAHAKQVEPQAPLACNPNSGGCQAASKSGDSGR